MAIERQDYPALLPQLQPGQAVDVLSDRVRQVGRLNTAIADWLQDRRRLEEQYSAGLRRLARKSLDDVDLGIFSVPWSTLTASADTLADSHSVLASKIEVDVERPLREFVSSNRESQAMTTIQGNLAAMAREVERAQQKAEKLQSRGGRAETGKAATASSDLDSSQSQWDSQAPYIFEALQALDEVRLNHLRDVLTQFQTHEVDLVEKSRTTAEHCLNVLLSVETADEIKTFSLKALSTRPRPTQRSSTSAAASSATPGRAPTFPSLAPTVSVPDDESQFSASAQEDKKGRLKGLKRLSTVIGRKKEGKQLSNLAPMPESPERPKQKASPFRFGRSRDSSTLEPFPDASEKQRPGSNRLGSEVFQPPPGPPAEPTSPTPARQSTATPQVNGVAYGMAAAPILSNAFPNGSHQGELADLRPPKPSQPIERQAEQVAQPVKDSEGYSAPPSQALDAISQAQQEAATAGDAAAPVFNVNIRDEPIQDGGDSHTALTSVAGVLQAPPPSRRLGTLRGRRDARNSGVPGSFAPPPEQIEESAPHQSSTSPVPVEQTKEMLPPQTSAAPAVQPPALEIPQAASTAVSSSPAAAAAFTPFTPAGSNSLPFRPDSRVAAGQDLASADNQSIRSGRSLTSTASQGMKHPDLTEAGLNSSVVETVTARFEHGKLLSCSLIGEIALAYNPADFSSPFGNETIRLENFSGLEKVAPNPAFISQLPDREGEYSVNLSHIAKTQIAFKYQVRADNAFPEAPLLLAPAFKIEPSQAFIIVSYSLNPTFNLRGRESITLTNVLIGLTLEGSKATSCQSKPAGTFSRDRNLIFWQLGEITLKAGAAPEKLLARFATESESKSGNVEARWEIAGEHAHGLGSGLAVTMQVTGAGNASDPFADEQGSSAVPNWKGVAGVRKLMSGAYTAK